MKRSPSGIRGKTLLFLFILIVILVQPSCYPRMDISRSVSLPSHVSNWVNWNYVFKEGTDSATRQATIAQITGAIGSVSSTAPVDGAIGKHQAVVHPLTSYLSDYLKGVLGDKSRFSLDSVEIHFCTCHDSLLWNLTANLNVGGLGESAPTPPTPPGPGASGQSAPSPPGPPPPVATGQSAPVPPQPPIGASGQSTPTPPPPPNPGASGQSIDAVDNNGPVSSPSSTPPVLTSGLVGFTGHPEVSGKVVLGIIDSGIDSTLFDKDVFQQLFAPDGSGKVNLVQGAPVSAYQDKDGVRHGSAVAAIALNAFYARSQAEGRNELPRLMVIRALDANGVGSTLSVSCALSYAIRHRVSLINASLGYWNAQNTVIDHYLQQSARYGIPVVAAAGNDPRAHTSSMCGETIDTHNLLRPGNLFYPASQSIDPQYCIISVTGLSSPTLPCRYQNFSSQYVSVGVVNQANSCCGFSLPFINSGYVLDGSSFATPVVSGQLGYKILRNGARSNTATYLQLLQPQKIATGFLTWDGQYITY